MASSGSCTRARPVIYHSNTDSHYITEYHGAQGRIDNSDCLSMASDRDGYDDAQLSASATTPQRSALGSRWLSTLSNGQSGAALKRSGSVLHSRAKSLAAFVPKLTTNPTTTLNDATQPPQQTNRIFGNLFSGESAPANIGIAPPSPIEEESGFTMEYKPNFTENPVGTRRRNTAQGSRPSTCADTGRRSSGWFTRKAAQAPAPPSAEDDIQAININNALFPNGPVDQFSPHAFNDLLLNATQLLQRMQGAYKEKVDYIIAIKSEVDVQKEEVEEVETRSRLLRLQLEDMNRKADDQNKMMQELALQLAEEKVKVRAQNTVTLEETAGEVETPRQRKRASAGSASDSGFESDAEYAESIISSAAETPLLPPSLTLTPHLDQLNPGQGRERPSLPSRQSTLSQPSRPTAHSCANGNRGGSASAAWTTVGTLREENQDLREQMDAMQKMLQGCIEFVDTMKA